MGELWGLVGSGSQAARQHLRRSSALPLLHSPHPHSPAFWCRWSYLGLGEPLCFLAFGPLATCAFYLAQVPAAQVRGGWAGIGGHNHPGLGRQASF